MSHHASGPNFGFPRGDARLDMTDLYAFAKPGDPSKSIIVLNVHPSFRLDSPEPTTKEPFKPGALIRNQDRHEWRCSDRSYLQRPVRIFRRREADCDSAPSPR